MIRVAVDIAGGLRVYEHPNGAGWHNDEDGNLDISDPDGNIIASYRAHHWVYVQEVAEDRPQETNDTGTMEAPATWSASLR